MEQTEAAAADSGEGRKIFLLYPPSVVHDEMIDILIMSGFETYTLQDHKRALHILEKFPGSIMFVNIDEKMSEKEWEVYIRGILENLKTKNTRLGILSYDQDRALMEKYLMRLALPCGYIQLKLGIQESTRIMANVLEANEARGRRKFIRAVCEDDSNATMNYKDPDGFFQGKILDISSAGIAARIRNFPNFPANSVLKEVQLKLRGALVMSNMILMGRRKDDLDVQILLFDSARLNPDYKLVIHHYIKLSLQKYIDSLKI